MTRDEKIAGLRELADWLEANPDAPVPGSAREFSYYVLVSNDPDGIAKVREIAAALGLSVTVADDGVHCTREFPGGIAWHARYLYRERTKRWAALMSYRDSVAVE